MSSDAIDRVRWSGIERRNRLGTEVGHAGHWLRLYGVHVASAPLVAELVPRWRRQQRCGYVLV